MTNLLDTREAGQKFTAAEFKAIPRNLDGDIIDLYDAYNFITDDQRALLSNDDYSRMDDLDEEMRINWAEFFDC